MIYDFYPNNTFNALELKGCFSVQLFFFVQL